MTSISLLPCFQNKHSPSQQGLAVFIPIQSFTNDPCDLEPFLPSKRDSLFLNICTRRILLFFIFFLNKIKEEKMITIRVLVLLIVIIPVSSFSCDQGQCYCLDNRITCIDITGPKFRYRVNVNILYMNQVQILDSDSIIRNLPNLEHISMIDMRYFRCEWLNKVPSEVHIHTNMCQISTQSTLMDAETRMTTGELCNKFVIILTFLFFFYKTKNFNKIF